jgi:2,4-dienoyl-CoA reductase-like NADH-dependent reductase (Old Yellow Enzyme family)/thioredoxin reductase
MREERSGLFEPGRIGALELPNRTIMAPMGTGYADDSGAVTDQLIAYHVARARGGVGLNITEHTAVARSGLTSPTMLALYDDGHMAGFRALCEAVHSAGGRIAVQLNHGGRQVDLETAGEAVAPSRCPTPSGSATARALSKGEIGEIVAAYGQAARRARTAGVDGIEVHMAHGYLGASFLSPLTNQREDEYGGDTVRRCQFAREVFAEIRRVCGDEVALWCRISADEFMDGGMELGEARRVAPLLVKAGAQAIHVSGCVGETARFASAPYYEPCCNLAHLAEGIKQVVDVPVIAAGRILFPRHAEDLLARGACDFVALGRSLLADPDWPRKAERDAEAEIRPCIGCNIGCLHRRVEPVGVCFCLTNPRTGREKRWPAHPPRPTPRKVLVVGGGPAGMAAAGAFAESGHSVELWEAGRELGGAFALACVPPGKGDLRPFLDYQVRQLERSGVTVRLETEGTADEVKAFGADIVIVATGAEQPPVPTFPGATQQTTFLADDVLGGLCSLGERVAVVGAGRTGTETAHYLAEAGHLVVLVEASPSIGREIPSTVRAFLEEKLTGLGVEMLTSTEAVQVVPSGLLVVSSEGPEPWDVPAHSVVLALPRRSRGWLATELEDAGIESVAIVGDARRPRSAQEAVYEGAHAALQLGT